MENKVKLLRGIKTLIEQIEWKRDNAIWFFVAEEILTKQAFILEEQIEVEQLRLFIAYFVKDSQRIIAEFWAGKGNGAAGNQKCNTFC
jgi:hypothetical protein